MGGTGEMETLGAQSFSYLWVIILNDVQFRCWNS
jgi:hypothetical protein